jgi:hypothetical protein
MYNLQMAVLDKVILFLLLGENNTSNMEHVVLLSVLSLFALLLKLNKCTDPLLLVTAINEDNVFESIVNEIE